MENKYNRLPITEELIANSEFRNVWDTYANTFNLLSERLQQANIKVKYLHNAIKSVEDLERLVFKYYLSKIACKPANLIDTIGRGE